MIVFTLKDHDLFGRNDFLGECYLPLDSIPFTTTDTKLQDLPQIYLSLTKPQDPNTTILIALENRHWDKAAVDFVKHERLKMPVNQPTTQ